MEAGYYKGNDLSKGAKKKITKWVVLALLPVALPLVFVILTVIISASNLTALFPSLDDEQKVEFKQVADACNVNWSEFLAYLTVVYGNEFTDMDPESIMLDFVELRVDYYEEVEKSTTKSYIKDDGTLVEVTTTRMEWELDHTATYQTASEIEAVSVDTGGPSSGATAVAEHLKSLGTTEEYDVVLLSKEVRDFYDDLTEEQQEWYSMLMSENVVSQMIGDYYELPEHIIVDTAGFFAYPTPGNTRITSQFGWRTDPVYGTQNFHSGLDIGLKVGSPVIAAADGVVVSASFKTTGYGYNVILEHVDKDGNKWNTRYAHLDQIVAKVGEPVYRGDVIAASGSTGKSTGPHLHFEIIYNGSKVNPELFVTPQ